MASTGAHGPVGFGRNMINRGSATASVRGAVVWAAALACLLRAAPFAAAAANASTSTSSPAPDGFAMAPGTLPKKEALAQFNDPASGRGSESALVEQLVQTTLWQCALRCLDSVSACGSFSVRGDKNLCYLYSSSAATALPFPDQDRWGHYARLANSTCHYSDTFAAPTQGKVKPAQVLASFLDGPGACAAACADNAACAAQAFNPMTGRCQLAKAASGRALAVTAEGYEDFVFRDRAKVCVSGSTTHPDGRGLTTTPGATSAPAPAPPRCADPLDGFGEPVPGKVKGLHALAGTSAATTLRFCSVLCLATPWCEGFSYTTRDRLCLLSSEGDAAAATMSSTPHHFKFGFYSRVASCRASPRNATASATTSATTTGVPGKYRTAGGLWLFS